VPEFSGSTLILDLNSKAFLNNFAAEKEYALPFEV